VSTTDFGINFCYFLKNGLIGPEENEPQRLFFWMTVGRSNANGKSLSCFQKQSSPTEQFMTTSDLEKLKFIRDSKEAIKKRSKRNSTCSQ